MKTTEKTPAASAIEMNELVLPTHTNGLGTIFGGTVLAWIDVAAAMAAQRHARRVVVTASMEAVDFKAPIRLGHLVKLVARVVHVRRTSMMVFVEVTAEDPLTGDSIEAVSAHVTFVALDEAHRPAEVPGLMLETDEDKERSREASAIRQARRLRER